MKIYLIIALYQGIFDGVELATLSMSEAALKYRTLIRETLGFMREPWNEV